MDRQGGDNKAEKTKRKGPNIRAGEVKEITADPRAKCAPQSKAHFEITENQSDLPSGKNIADDRAVGGSTGALADAETDCS